MSLTQSLKQSSCFRLLQTPNVLGYLFLVAILVLWQSSCSQLNQQDSSYKRSLYSHWSDADGDCQNTRHELLIINSLQPVTFTNAKKCTVKTGLWWDPYTGRSFTLASDLDIDHLVPLAHAHAHGGDAWDAQKRKAFANDSINLVAVDDETNRNKSAKAPQQWMPPNKEYWCQYVSRWQAVKDKYQLTYGLEEKQFIQQLWAQCLSPIRIRK